MKKIEFYHKKEKKFYIKVNIKMKILISKKNFVDDDDDGEKIKKYQWNVNEFFVVVEDRLK